MLRRISTKLVLAVLAAVVLPFVAFAVFIDHQIANRLTRDVVRQALRGLVQDLAGQVDRFVEERRQDVVYWAGTPLAGAAIDELHAEEGRLRLNGDEATARRWDAATLVGWARTGVVSTAELQDFGDRLLQTRELDRVVELEGVVDLVLLVDERGRLVTMNSRLPEGALVEEELVAALFAHDYALEPWFAPALAGSLVNQDQHVSPLAPGSRLESPDPADRRHVGFAAPVRRRGRVIGVLYALVGWRHVQELVAGSAVKESFRGLVAPGEDPTPYAWIWGADADTILAHPVRELYGRSVSLDVELPQMTRQVLDDPDGSGLWDEYTFRGETKNAAYERTRHPDDGGFHWVVGLGIDNQDIYATSSELRRVLLGGTAVVLGMAVVWTLVIARRTTRPIRELRERTRRVAEGRLDGAPPPPAARDELGELARDFDRMTHELARQREQLVKAEKDAAWREMARQIAHDIKNPLTPMQLSLDLLERARRERNPGYDEILERTLDLVGRQVKNLREIAGDFYEFTGGRRPEPQAVELGELVDEVLRLHDAWAVEQGVEVQREGVGGLVWADPGKLRRALGNLVANALQAMPDGGRLEVEVGPVPGPAGEDRVRVLVRDTGVGIRDEARDHLFEPYFTTKSEGTGLGLAIARRVVEELGGTIELRSPSPDAGGGRRGTVAEVALPLHRPAAARGTSAGAGVGEARGDGARGEGAHPSRPHGDAAADHGAPGGGSPRP